MRKNPEHFVWLAAFWIAVYLLLTALPLFLLLFSPAPSPRGFWRDFSAALGFAGLAMMMLQFALTARLQTVKAPFGSDLVYHFHRQISQVAFGLILAHPLILFVTTPSTVSLLKFWNAPWRARFAVAALAILIVQVGSSIWRRQLRLDYDRWRFWHGVLASAAVVLGLLHMMKVGHFVNLPWKRSLWLSHGALWVGLLAYVRLLKPWLALRQPYEVVAVNAERGQAWSLTLRAKGHHGLRFNPGQFAWLTLWHSPFLAKDHPFSFSASAERPELLRFTIKELGDFTATIKQAVPGQLAWLDGPHGAFSVDRYPHAPGYVFIAGGIGITPMMSMLHTLADRRDPRPLLLLYANRDLDSITFREEIEQLAPRLNLRVAHVLDRPPENWTGESGFINDAVLQRQLPEEFTDLDYFICGPPPMMNAVEQLLLRRGIPFGQIHTERFNLV